jgi:hypothetical protein
MTEPQTITTALTAQLAINKIFRDQIKRRVIFSPISIISPFEVTGFDSLIRDIREKGTFGDMIQKIQEAAIENINLYSDIQAIDPGAKEIAYYELHGGNVKRYMTPHDPGAEIYTNHQLAVYCDEVEDFMSRYQSKVAPPANDQELSHNQIALINYYNGITITQDNAAEIANKSGWINKTSGHKIWQQYLYFVRSANRMAIPDNPTPTTKRNKIELFESVLLYLNDAGKQKAEAEIKSLKIKLQAD